MNVGITSHRIHRIHRILINRVKVTKKYTEGFESTEFVADYVTTAGAVGTEKGERRKEKR